MRDILRLCVEMDTLSHDVYRRLTDACEDPKLKAQLERMATDELAHIDWWNKLLESWDEGLIPDIFPDSEDAESRMRALHERMRAAVPEDVSGLSPREMIAIAARLEFFMLDPVFSELLTLAEPALAERRQQTYHEHVARVIEAIRGQEEPDSLLGFLSDVLDRVWRDNVELAQHSACDPLTGLLNRRSFNTHLEQLTAWSARYARPVTVILLDIDNFKTVNDTFGHQVGDQVLVEVGRALRRLVRTSDMVARYGGDEFAIIAPETDAEQARLLSSRIVETARSVCAAHEGRTICITVSVGSATTARRAESTRRLMDELVAAADHSMYSAKAAGRNRAGEAVEFAAPA